MRAHKSKIFIRGSEAKILKKHIPLFKEVVQKYMYKKRLQVHISILKGL